MLTAGGHMNLWNKDLYTTEGIGIGHCHNCDNSGNPSIEHGSTSIKLSKSGLFWNCQGLLLKISTEIFLIDAS